MTLADVLEELRVPFRVGGTHHHVSRGWLGVDCPRCSPGSNRFRLGLHLTTHAASCWTCGRTRLGDALSEITGLPFERLAERFPGLFARGRVAVDPRPVGRYTPPPGVGPLGAAHRGYLIRRGFDPERCAELYGFGGIGPDGPYRWRIFVPVTYQKKPVSWTTRAVGSKIEQRYLSAPPEHESRPIKSCLFGADLATGPSVVVVEGLFGAVRIGPGAVATFGLAYTRSQLRQIARYPVRAICFDTEPAAQRVASRLCDELAAFPGATYRVTLSGPDPDTSPDSEIAELRSRFLV